MLASQHFSQSADKDENMKEAFLNPILCVLCVFVVKSFWIAE
jgi:hypothetical protein